MNIKERIKRNKYVVSLRLLNELIYNFKRLVRNLGEINTSKNRDKYFANLLILVHSIEKGLALPNPKKGFGKEKIKYLLENMKIYKSRFGMDKLFEFSKPVLDSYFSFCDGAIDVNLYNIYKELFKDFTVTENRLGGVISVNKSSINNSIAIDYESFVNSRYSVRDFSEEDVSIDLIYKALEISSKSPSACNRQPWGVYIYKDIDKKNELLKWQLGNNGFGNQINTALLITCKLNGYFINEVHQAYVDGGLYSMSILYALHSLGLGGIPLTTAMMANRSKILYSKFGLDDSEVPIVIIGLGHLKDNFNVAVSERFPIDSYTTLI